MKTRNVMSVLTALSLLLVSPVHADDRDSSAYGPGMGYGHPMMGQGWNGMGPGYGHGGYGGRGGMRGGPGMMNDAGQWGMDGYGPGMMGGYGMGMMGGHGMGMMGGPGMGRMALLWQLDLSDAQQDKLDSIHDTLHQKHFGLMAQMWEAGRKLAAAYRKDTPDPAEIGKAYMAQAEVQRQMLEARVAAENEMMAVLTAEQKASLGKNRRRGMPW